jgi:uncharacterized protein YozE (UPF0346 family)
MSIDISRLAFAIRTDSAQSPHPIKLSQAQQCIAAALSFQSLAALQASDDGNVSLDHESHVVLDVAGLLDRSQHLELPHDELLLVGLIREAFRKKHLGVQLHVSPEKFEDALRDFVQHRVLNHEETSGAMAVTNNDGIDEIYLPFDIDWKALPANGDPLEIKIEGHVSMEIDQERPYTGHRINVTVTLWLSRLGRTIYWVACRVDSAQLNWDHDERDEPPKVSLTEALAEELNLSFDEADDLAEAEAQQIEDSDDMTSELVLDFTTTDASKALLRKIQKKHGSLSVWFPIQFFERVYGFEPQPVRHYVHGDQIEGVVGQYLCVQCDMLVDASHFRTEHPGETEDRYFGSLRNWQKRSAQAKIKMRRAVNVVNILAADAEAERLARESSRSDFHRWLERQIKREDQIGGLARDVKGDRSFPSSNASPDGIRAYLWQAAASTAAVEAFERAWTEFTSRKGRS